MTQPLIEKLHHLDSILHDIRQRYDASHNELLSLKNGPQIEETSSSIWQHVRSI